MKVRVLALASAATALIALAAHAASDHLDLGSTAPDFTAPAYLAGKSFTFNLNDALKKGPVVVYFFPAAYTPGCQIEAHLFAEAADEFKAQHATVIGVTAGNTDKLEKFSTDTQYCSGKFAMALDDGAKIATTYKSTFAERPMSDRTSYVIGKDHKIALVYSNLNPNDHVTQTMAAVKKLNGKS
jgi:peroxiredoxin